MKNRNSRSFVAFLSALSHDGECSAAEAEALWREEISGRADLENDRFLVSAFVDCFVRKGFLRKALDTVTDYEQRMHCDVADADSVLWMTLLSGCDRHAQRSVDLCCGCSAVYDPFDYASDIERATLPRIS